MSLQHSVRQGDPDYERTRQAASWNRRLPDRYPALIVHARDTTEVVAAVRYARDHGLAVKARSGGHSWTASSIRQGAMLIDLSAMTGIAYDPGARTAVVGPGVHGRQLNQLLAADDLFFPTGHCSTVALGGFLLQGGWGWNSRSVGPACLSVEGVDVVTAEGEQIHASREENYDYWWAARGAGPGYFGIVTAFHLRLHQRPAAMRRTHYLLPLDGHAEVLSWAFEVGPRLPAELEFSVLATGPRGVEANADRFDTSVIVAAQALMSDDDAAMDALSLLHDCPGAAKAIDKAIQVPTSLDELYMRSDAIEQEGYRWSADNMWTDARAEQLIPGISELFTSLPSAMSHVLWYQWAPQDFADAAVSIQGNLYIAAYAGWSDPAADDRMAGWARDGMARLAPLSNGITLADENLVERPAAYLSPDNERRLEAMRARHDPGGLFLSYLVADAPIQQGEGR